MAFTLNNWSCVSASLAQGQETITPFGGSPTVENSPNLFTYGSPVDTVATISASNYFLAQYASLSVGDWILGFGTDATLALQVTASSSTSVTVESTGLTTNIGTGNIVNGAVTLAKLAAGITPAAVIKFAAQYTTSGGSATEAITVTGAVAATDRAFVQVVNNGTNNVTVLQAVVTTNTLTITFSGDPAADTIINYQLIRAAS